jgi:hypothetical protein
LRPIARAVVRRRPPRRRRRTRHNGRSVPSRTWGTRRGRAVAQARASAGITTRNRKPNRPNRRGCSWWPGRRRHWLLTYSSNLQNPAPIPGSGCGRPCERVDYGCSE